MKQTTINLISVSLDRGETSLRVGRLASRDHRIYFEYDPECIKRKLEISPFHLPLKAGLQSFDNSPFDGLPGIFNDSLPDGWGRLLLDRAIRARGGNPAAFTPLDRLAHVGRQGMGALTYEPDHGEHVSSEKIHLNTLAAHARDVLEGKTEAVFEELLALNGSSAGARPKALIGVSDGKRSIVHGVADLPEHYEHWLVKFPNTQDGPDSGAIEYVYAEMARASGVEMTETHLFPAKRGAGYFATKRFDRDHNGRIHVHTACGLLHTDFRAPSLDYEDLIKATLILTKDTREVEKMFRLAVFNVLAHNRDDHAKNFSFLMDEDGQWKLAPAYDLTFSSGPRGQQSTMVMGEGNNPTVEHLIALAHIADIDAAKAGSIIEQTKATLNTWPKRARQNGVSKTKRDAISKAVVPSPEN